MQRSVASHNLQHSLNFFEISAKDIAFGKNIVYDVSVLWHSPQEIIKK